MIHKTTNIFSRELSAYFDERFSEFGLATSYIELMLLVRGFDGEATQKVLAEKMNLAPSTITRFMSKLIKIGLVKKTRKGREVAITLSSKGKKEAEKMEQVYKKAESDLRQKLGGQFVETTEKLLEHGLIELIKQRKD